MITDKQGNALSGATIEAAAFFNEAAEAFNIYRGDPVGIVDNATAVAPDFAMAHIFKAYLFGLATEPQATKEAKAIVANSFGGSHAQRDIIDWTLAEASVRGGLTGLAESLANERLALKPHSPVNRSFLTRSSANESPDRKVA